MSKFRDLGTQGCENVEIALPLNVRPTRLWPESMHEMAAHIGAYATMLIVDRFGGLNLSVPRNPDLCATLTLIGHSKTVILCDVYGREDIAIPVASAALREARMQGVVASIRAKNLTQTEAVIVLRGAGIRTSVSQISALINRTELGIGVPQYTPKRARDPRQMVLFDGETDL